MLIFKRRACSKFNWSSGAKIKHSFVLDLVKTASRFCSSICGSNEKVSKSVSLQLETWSLNKPWQLQMAQAFISKVFLILIHILTELERINISISVSPDSRIQESEFAEGGTKFAHELSSLLRFLLEFMEFCNPAAFPHASQLVDSLKGFSFWLQ